MEDEWDMVDSVGSSKSDHYRPSLNFNRFDTMPEYDHNNDTLCESPPPVDNEQVTDLEIKDCEFTLGDSCLLKDHASGDESSDSNQAQFNNQNDSMNIPFLSSYLPFHQQSTTRESQVDKSTIWKNSISGSSVPYMSSNPTSVASSQAEPTSNTKSIFTPMFFSSPFILNTDTHKAVANSFPNLQTKQKGLSEEDSDAEINTRPIKQPKRSTKRTPALSQHSLPSFAAAPKELALTTQKSICEINIDPAAEATQSKEEEEEEEGETNAPELTPKAILERVSECIAFSSDQGDLRALLFDMQKKAPVIEWYLLTKLDLSRQHLVNLTGIAGCFPSLQVLNVAHNELKSISGLPNSLIYLYASDNRLPEIDIYHLEKLQHLDVSHNLINSFEDLSRLGCLRVLDASHNTITSCKAFQDLPGLIKLNLKANCIRRLINFEEASKSNQLESLDVSHNRIEMLDSIESLVNLRELNADHNQIKYIQLDQSLEHLCKLQLSYNRLKSFDVSQFPDIRVLYLDDNQIQRIIGIAYATRLESFSMRDQGGHKIDYDIQYLRGTRKLYLSGNTYTSMNRMIDFYSLQYLEICSAGLEVLPSELGKHMPNLVTLNLSMNRLTDIRPLRKLKYLCRLVLIDNRLMSLNEVISVVQNLRHLHYLDLRQNPICANIYPSLSPLLLQNTSEYDGPSRYVATDLDDSWEALDNEHLPKLSDQWRTRREVYRALIIQKCPKLLELDHLSIDTTIRSQSERVIGDFKKSQTSYAGGSSTYSSVSQFS